ncbi:MAG: matrixin family metalloprotease [Kofleriaceae bacterium]
MPPRFQLTTTLRRGDAGPDAGLAQRYLARFGYLNTAGPGPDVLDAATSDALAAFQRRLALPETGDLDAATKLAMEQPRCGNPDLHPSPGGPVAEFVLRGCSYFAKHRTLTYALTLGTPDLSVSAARAAIARALATWSAEVGLDFAEVDAASGPVLTFGWYTGDHGDGSAFDGAGNTLAHAFYPPTCGGTYAGRCHFDDDEGWSTAPGPGQFDLETVALHEIGHLLGLSHSTVAGAVMFPTYGGPRRALTADDVAGIRALYGRRGATLDVRVHLQDIADLTFRDNQFAGTRGQSRRLEGFQLVVAPAVPGLGLRYMAHLQDIGDVPWVNGGTFVGTRGQSRRLEGFAIELTGPAAGNFTVEYMAHLQDLGDTGLFRDGQFCGTRGQSRRVEGILVRVIPR